MENKEFNDPKSTNQNVVDQNRLRSAKKEGLTRGALTTGIIGLSCSWDWEYFSFPL
jgi:hypothetical protein